MSLDPITVFTDRHEDVEAMRSSPPWARTR
jgi:hypothetical protein